MLSKKLFVILFMATMIVSTLVTDLEAAASNRKEEKVVKEGKLTLLIFHGTFYEI